VHDTGEEAGDAEGDAGDEIREAAAEELGEGGD